MNISLSVEQSEIGRDRAGLENRHSNTKRVHTHAAMPILANRGAAELAVFFHGSLDVGPRLLQVLGHHDRGNIDLRIQ